LGVAAPLVPADGLAEAERVGEAAVDTEVLLVLLVLLVALVVVVAPDELLLGDELPPPQASSSVVKASAPPATPSDRRKARRPTLRRKYGVLSFSSAIDHLPLVKVTRHTGSVQPFQPRRFLH
jgi:hypothetical protein